MRWGSLATGLVPIIEEQLQRPLGRRLVDFQAKPLGWMAQRELRQIRTSGQKQQTVEDDLLCIEVRHEPDFKSLGLASLHEIHDPIPLVRPDQKAHGALRSHEVQDRQNALVDVRRRDKQAVFCRMECLIKHCLTFGRIRFEQARDP